MTSRPTPDINETEKLKPCKWCDLNDVIPWEHEKSDVCRFCSGDLRYHQYEDYAECKEKELSEINEQLRIARAGLDSIASWTEGGTVTGMFDEPESAQEARETLTKISEVGK